MLVIGITGLIFEGSNNPLLNVLGVLGFIIDFMLLTGFCMNFPNETRVVTFFGNYIGTVSKTGFWLTVPFTIRTRVTLRVRNFNSDKLKVNDVEGNPIEIAAVVVFKVINPSKAIFDVDRYEQFVEIQSETSLRHIASIYPYDDFEGAHPFSLRGNADEIAEELKQDLQKRLAIAGVEVLEARLMHLTYSSEIAQAMLQRQQASAIIAARKKIVEGATSMVQETIEMLEKNGTVKMTDQEKARMVNNLMVAIVSERSANPVVDLSSK
jgi:regulator of protease activity HflC (stomatin/prohibitin superfamily)